MNSSILPSITESTEGHDDKTHFNAYGAQQIAGLVVDGLKADERTAKYIK